MRFGFLFLGLLLLFSCSRQVNKSFITQEDISFDDSKFTKEPGNDNPCRSLLNYSPDEKYPQHTPTRFIRTNVHLMANEKGDNNFSLEEGIEYAKMLVDRVNEKLRKNYKMSLPIGNNTPVLPIKYQFVLVDKPDHPGEPAVYHHRDEEVAYYVKKGRHRNTYDRRMFERYGVQKGEVLNIFLLEHHIDSIASPTYRSTVDGVGFSQWLKVVGSYQHLYLETTLPDGSTKKEGPLLRSEILNHEIGHTLGLSHTWNSNDGCDDTPLHPGCWDYNSEPCKETGIYSNNMMDYNNCQCALSPCQLAKIHYNFSKENSTQRKLLLPTWCDYKADSSIVIGMFDDVTWNSAKDLEGDIIINNGGKLTIQCEVSLPKEAKVIVKPKGTLVLDGGIITNKCEDQWAGIEVWKTKKNEASVIFANSPIIEKVVHSPSVGSD